MGMMGVFKWLRKDIIQRDRHRRIFSPKFNGLNNESYRTALHAFLERRKDPSDPGYIISPNSPDKAHLDFFTKNSNGNNTIKDKDINAKCNVAMSKVPIAQASEIFEIAWVAGTEDRYMDFIYAEWQNTKVCLRRYTHPDCKSAVEADLDVLGKIRHPNLLLLMGTTQTDDHGLIAIYETIDCTLFNYIHEQGERVAIQGIAKCAGNLAAALKHAHMLGYVHTAISSHCVFLGSNGIVKLGGWELSTDINRPIAARSYETRLRAEIFRWQAPELFIGRKPSTATDVYGLTLLMWEMCTMNIPWNGLNVAEVENQYVQRRQSVITDIYNFPPILNNLLEAGLQLDDTKRTLNMIKMSRFLQRLEMQYEDEEPIYIEQLTNNNDQQKCINMSSIDISLSPNIPAVPNCRSTFNARRQNSNKLTSLANQTSEKPIKKNEFHETLPDIQENCIKIVDKVFQTQIKKNTDFTNAKLNGIQTTQEMKIHNQILSSDCETNKIDNVTNEDIEHINDSRLSIKKLKETLATRRENFFYGDGSLCDPISSIDEVSKTSILSQVRSKDYEPHKPASHKTSLQPKQITSPSQLSTSITKSSYKKNERSPYSYVPTPVRNAVIQPQILNRDSQSFFETSLWRKEKLICLSKMRRENSQDYKFGSQYYSENMATQKNTSPASDETFTVDGNPSVEDFKQTGEHFAPINDSAADITASTIPRSKSLQALKDALERATDIVRSTTPITSTSTDISPFKSPKEFNGAINNSNINELVFDELHELDELLHGETKRIEKSTSGDTFTVVSEHSIEYKDDQEVLQPVSDKVSQDALSNTISSEPFLSRRKFQYASIADNSTKHEFFNMTEKKNEEKLKHLTRSETARCISQNEVICEESDRCFALFGFGNTKTKDMGCLSCSRNGLIRRRSLPTELEQLSAGNYASLRKLRIKKSGLPDATVEDLYIDDEFDETSLAPNMILLNDDTVTDDENYFPDLLDSKTKYAHS